LFEIPSPYCKGACETPFLGAILLLRPVLGKELETPFLGAILPIATGLRKVSCETQFLRAIQPILVKVLGKELVKHCS
jgi:hypothetical protein